MSIKSKNKRVGLCVMAVTSCLIMATLLAVLATPETALAKKPAKPEDVLHGSATFLDDPGDRVQSDGGGPYTDADTGKNGTVLGLGGFFRLQVKLDRKGQGRSFDLNFEGLEIDSLFFPASENIWILGVDGTLASRAQDEGVGIPREGSLLLGQTGKDEAIVSYGRWGGNELTVTRTGTDVWTIQSLDSDTAAFYRHDVATVFGTGPMPFLVTYNGQ